jgi:erythromycin esterase-like protein
MSTLRRITNLFHRSKLDQDIDADLRSHIEIRTADNIAARVLALTLPPDCGAQGNSPAIHLINSTNLTEPSQYAFLFPILDGVEAVSLPESIHMTHEFPLLRLGIVRYLNENLGFHVLVIERSAPDVWIAQDRFLNSPRSQQDATQALGGFFGLWNTLEMRQLLEYEASSWSSANPLYIIGYDVQPGNGHGSQGAEVFRQLFERLSFYAPPPPGFAPERWMDHAEALLGGNSDAPRLAAASGAIDELQEWISRVEPVVRERFPSNPHALALGLIPANLRAVLTFRAALARHDAEGYQGLRDINAAANVLNIKQTMNDHKIILWAHLSHLREDDAGTVASVGAILHRTLGARLYTIVPFAESGGAIATFPTSNEDLGYARIRGNFGSLGKALSELSEQDYFLNLRSIPASDPLAQLLSIPQPVPVEAASARMTLTTTCDAIIWIKRVHAPDLTAFVLIVAVIHYQKTLAVGTTLLIALIAFVLILKSRRQHRRARHLRQNTGSQYP